MTVMLTVAMSDRDLHKDRPDEDGERFAARSGSAADADARRHGPKPPRGRLRRLLRWAGFATVLLMACFFGGFLYFADMVTSLTQPPDARADAIVVLTGGSQRLNQAMELLAKGAGQRLLISGVHPTTTASQIRRLTQTPNSIFHCCVDIGYEALDTIGNAAEAVDWIREHGYRRVIVVTNNYHMPCSLIELRRADPATEFIPYPVVNSNLKARNWLLDPGTLRVMLSEYAKILATGFRGITGLASLQDQTAHRAAETGRSRS